MESELFLDLYRKGSRGRRDYTESLPRLVLEGGGGRRDYTESLPRLVSEGE